MVDRLITLAECKAILRYTGNDNDPTLDMFIGAASRSILRWLKSDGSEYHDSNGNIVPGQVPDDVKIATAWLAGAMDKNRDVNEDNIFEADRLPKPIEALLHSLREPTIA